jgi:hypothetical protein
MKANDGGLSYEERKRPFGFLRSTRPSRLSGLRRRRPTPWLIPGQAGSDWSDYGREYLNAITAASS